MAPAHQKRGSFQVPLDSPEKINKIEFKVPVPGWYLYPEIDVRSWHLRNEGTQERNFFTGMQERRPLVHGMRKKRNAKFVYL